MISVGLLLQLKVFRFVLILVYNNFVTFVEQQPPEMVYCTESFEVQLEPHEQSRAVYWKEPVFNSQLHLKQIYRSKTPGSRLAAGVHYINYVATDIDGQSSKCNFRVDVRGNYLHKIIFLKIT